MIEEAARHFRGITSNPRLWWTPKTISFSGWIRSILRTKGKREGARDSHQSCRQRGPAPRSCRRASQPSIRNITSSSTCSGISPTGLIIFSIRTRELVPIMLFAAAAGSLRVAIDVQRREDGKRRRNGKPKTSENGGGGRWNFRIAVGGLR